jgi:dTDP-4-dehydrorhamnose 3,5-epimerase
VIFGETEIDGVFEIEVEAHRDERGFFARLFCPAEFEAAGIAFRSDQINLSRNETEYTLRGMHWQKPPFAEAKVVRVTAGAAYVVVVDLRRQSATYRQWMARTLDARRANALFVPEGCAHGFLTLEPGTDILYQMGRPFAPGQARGFCWDDPAIGIAWPAKPNVISCSDCAWPALEHNDDLHSSLFC